MNINFNELSDLNKKLLFYILLSILFSENEDASFDKMLEIITTSTDPDEMIEHILKESINFIPALYK